MIYRYENVDPQRDGMDEEIERAIQKGTISWKMIRSDSWPDHPEYKAKVCHAWYAHRCAFGDQCFYAHTHPQHPDTVEARA